MTDPGVGEELPVVSRQANDRKFQDERLRNVMSLEVGVQVSCCIYTEMPTESNIRSIATAIGRSIPHVGRAKGESDIGRALDARPCSYADIDSAKVCGVTSDWIYKRKECDPHCEKFWGA